MPLTRRQAPPDVAEAVDAALQHFAGVPEARLNALAGTRPGELTPTEPHPVFNLGLSDLRSSERALGASRATGWRFLLRQHDDVVASAETVATRGGDAQFSHFNRGPFVASTAAALERVEGLAGARDESYELRLLHVPALYTMAVWLHDDGDNDILVPIAPTPDGIEPNRAYPADELLAILAEKARGIPRMEPGDTRGG